MFVVQVREAITLSDPDAKVPFPIVNENTPERILTGGDFDIESVRQAPDGTFWFGEEFGPFIVHADAKGRVLDAPVPLPRVMSPDNPLLLGRTPNLPSSSGFEGMAMSTDGKTLYPFLEGAMVGDDPLVRHVYEFDVEERRYTGRNWIYRMSRIVSDAVAFSKDQLIVTERDNNQGAASVSATGSSSRTRPSRPSCRSPTTSWRSSTTPTSARWAVTQVCLITATSLS